MTFSIIKRRAARFAVLYAYEQENIAITGSGTLDGQADCDHWWPWKGKAGCGYKKGDPSQAKARAALMHMADRDVPVEERIFGAGIYLRPMFIQPYRCRNVLIEGVTIRNSPMWEIHPVLCRNVTVRNVTISSHGPNNDGCDPESSADVLIEGLHFRYRRRLHRDQIRPQPRRPPRQRAHARTSSSASCR